jgi:Arc/MetJ-type ribon-helix-helix transcriptional regulator
MATIHLTPRQASLSKALVKAGFFGNESEVGRAAFEKLIESLKPGQRREVALALYRDGEATVSRFAEIADLPLAEARALLRDEGLLKEETGESAKSLRANVDAGARRFK